MNINDVKVGDKVTYIPKHSNLFKDREVGVVSSKNDEWVFVRYDGGSTGKATRPDDLRKGDQTFYCADEHNSVLDGAFGRCRSVCSHCSHIKQYP